MSRKDAVSFGFYKLNLKVSRFLDGQYLSVEAGGHSTGLEVGSVNSLLQGFIGSVTRVKFVAFQYNAQCFQI